MSLPPLFADPPPAWRDHLTERPWDLLGNPLDDAMERLPSEAIDIGLPPGVEIVGDRIVIGRGTRIHPGAVLQGPLRIGMDCEIRPGAFLRGGVWIGDGCLVGASVEVKRAILFDGARVPHLSYVGDSILGRRVNLGAGTVLSNFRLDGAEIRIPGKAEIETGRRKLGAILGDEVHTGCNSVLHPGVIVGRGTSIYPGVQLRAGVYPADSVVKLRQQLEIVERTP